MNAMTAQKIQWQWDRPRRKLWANITNGTGQMVRVGFPLSQVAMIFEEELGRCGIVEHPQVGDFESVDGFLSRIKRTVKKAYKKVKQIPRATTRAATRGFVPKFVFKRVAPKFIKRAQSRLARKAISYQNKAHAYGKKYGMKAARSKALGATLGVAAVAFPAVGGPALAGWTAANRAVKMHDAAMAAKRAIQRGSRSPQHRAQLAKGRAIQNATRQLGSSPQARIARSALQSIPQVQRNYQQYQRYQPQANQYMQYAQQAQRYAPQFARAAQQFGRYF